MKTKEEIGKLAKEKYPDENTAGWIDHWSRSSQMEFIEGYTKCQQTELKQALEELDFYKTGTNVLQEEIERLKSEKKYTEEDLRRFADKIIEGMEERHDDGYRDIRTDYESLIKSLNKQV